MRLESGPARMDSLQLGIFAVACLAFSAYFFYDWKVGYIAANRAKARETLTPVLGGAEKVPAELGDRPSKGDFDALLAARTTKYDDVVARLGPPKFARDGTALGDVKYFYSDYGMATITNNGGTVSITPPNWSDWPNSKKAIDGQMYWGFGSGMVGLWVALLALKAATLKVTVDDTGMTYGRTRVPFDAMVRLTDYKKKGLCTLYYKDAGGQERRLRLDSYKVAKFEEIIDALCEARGFPNPRPTEQAEDEPRESSDAS